MDSSASDSRKEIVCTTNFSELSTHKKQQQQQQQNNFHSCENFVTHLFYIFSQV